MDFAILPPEINSARMYAGPGPGPMLAAATAWDGLAAELRSAAATYASVISGLTAGPWLGPSSAAMAAAASPYVAWMNTTAAQAEQTATQARMAATAYETAFAATVPPPMIAANRSLLTALIATNILGQNTPAIAATETYYAEMWAQDAAAMYGYADSSASATTLTPFTPPAPATNPGGLASQTAAVAQATGASAPTNTQTVLSQLTSAVPTALQGLASPLQPTSAAASSTSGLLGILQSLGFNLGGDVRTGLGAGGLSTASGSWGSATYAHAAASQTDADLISTQDQIAGMEGRIMNRFDQLGAATAVGSAGSAGLGAPAAVSAGLGRAALVGGLSVPPGWTAAAPAIRLAAAALPATSLGATPEVFAGSPGSLFSEMALASMAGRAIGGTSSPRLRERIGATVGQRAKLPEPQPANPVTGVAADHLRGLALAVLHDAGILTDEEFTEKRRLVSP
jgi:PPE-repeat protein